MRTYRVNNIKEDMCCRQLSETYIEKKKSWWGTGHVENMTNKRLVKKIYKSMDEGTGGRARLQKKLTDLTNEYSQLCVSQLLITECSGGILCMSERLNVDTILT